MMKGLIFLVCLVLAYANVQDGRKELCENLFDECEEASKRDSRYGNVCDDFKKKCMQFPCKQLVDFLLMGCENDRNPDQTTKKVCRKLVEEDYDAMFCGDDNEMKSDEEMERKKNFTRPENRCKIKGIVSYFNCSRKGHRENCTLVALNKTRRCEGRRNLTRMDVLDEIVKEKHHGNKSNPCYEKAKLTVKMCANATGNSSICRLVGWMYAMHLCHRPIQCVKQVIHNFAVCYHIEGTTKRKCFKKAAIDTRRLCSEQGLCALKTAKKHDQCIEKDGDHTACDVKAGKFIASHCIDRELPCKKQAKEYSKVCNLIQPNRTVCMKATWTFLKQCNGSDFTRPWKNETAGARNVTGRDRGFQGWMESACERFNFSRKGCNKVIEKERNITERDDFDEAMEYNGYNISCTDQTLSSYTTCMNIANNRTACKVIAKVYKEFLCDESVYLIHKVMQDFSKCFFEKRGNHCISVVRDSKQKYSTRQGVCSLKTIEEYDECMKDGGDKKNCSNQANEFVINNCINSSLPCKHQTKQYYDVCMLIHDNRRICRVAAKVFYEKRCGRDGGSGEKDCAQQTIEEYDECMKDGGDEKNCSNQANEFVINNCINSSLPCKHQTKQYYDVCMLIHDNRRICRVAAKVFYEKRCGRDGGSGEKDCAQQTIEEYHECMKDGGDEKNCSNQANEFAINNCINSSLPCKHQTRQYYNVCHKIHENEGICKVAAINFYKDRCGGDGGDDGDCRKKAAVAFYECLENTDDDARFCGVAAGNYFLHVCKKNKSCAEDVKDAIMMCYHGSTRSRMSCARRVKYFVKFSSEC